MEAQPARCDKGANIIHTHTPRSAHTSALGPGFCALQVSLPEIDGAMEPIIYAGREGATGRSVPLADRVQLVADRALKVGLMFQARHDVSK